MKSRSWTLCATCIAWALSAGSLSAAERWTLNHRTCDPRPDILVHPFYDAHVEYRQRYNRPRLIPGWIASKIAPSSQEAMVWRENYCAGRYRDPHTPPVYKQYYYPKPWEVLTTGGRSGYLQGDAAPWTAEPIPDDAPSAAPSRLPPSTEPPPLPAPTEERSPSDLR
ncbi:MAG: hypothetical protein D6753_14530 [Planctomycetota bacterium]|nr:MAG: hypothetical protein D6753_14530 [Planctomycetota bacterium]